MTVYDRTTHHFLEACENSSYFYYTEIKLSKNKNKKKHKLFILYKQEPLLLLLIVIAHRTEHIPNLTIKLWHIIVPHPLY